LRARHDRGRTSDAIVVCPRHGSRFDLETGIPMTLPAFLPVPTYPVSVVDGMVVVEVGD
jgi:3-phenylpropionate/trans-cinnamate dioxygenase ferredoxin subunit